MDCMKAVVPPKCSYQEPRKQDERRRSSQGRDKRGGSPPWPHSGRYFMRAWPLILALLGWLVLVPADRDGTLPRREEETAIDYRRDVLPILAHTCFNCHGPSEQKSGLRLDLRASAVQRTRSGSVPIVPGQAAASEVIRRIFAADEA